MQQFTDAFSSIPEGHLGICIGFLAVFGAFTVGLVAVWRGISAHSRLMEMRSNLIVEMLKMGLSSKEILAILDHPTFTTMSGQQRKHSKAVLAMLDAKAPVAAKPPPKPMLEKPPTVKNGQTMSQMFS